MTDAVISFARDYLGIAITDVDFQQIFVMAVAVCLVWMLYAFMSGKPPGDDFLTSWILSAMFGGAAYALYKVFPRLFDVFVDTVFVGCIAFCVQFFRLGWKRWIIWLAYYLSPEHKQD